MEKRKLFTVDNGQPHRDEPSLIVYSEIEVPDYYATIHTDTEQILGVVGKDYKVVQNTAVIQYF